MQKKQPGQISIDKKGRASGTALNDVLTFFVAVLFMSIGIWGLIAGRFPFSPGPNTLLKGIILCGMVLLGLIGCMASGSKLWKRLRRSNSRLSTSTLNRLIVYTAEGADFVERVSTDLQTYGLSCHFEQTDAFKEAKEHVISLQKRYDQLLMVLSQQAWSDEWVKGLAKGWRNVERVKATTYLLPLLLERPTGGAKDTWTSQMLNATKTEDFTQWRDEEQYQQALQKLVNDLRAIS